MTRFTSLLFVAGLGYSIGALMLAREAKRRLQPCNGLKENFQAYAALVISACIIVWMISTVIIGILMVLGMMYIHLTD